MRAFFWSLWSLGLLLPWSFAAAQNATVIVVAGASGEADYTPEVEQQAEAWAKDSGQASRSVSRSSARIGERPGSCAMGPVRIGAAAQAA